MTKTPETRSSLLMRIRDSNDRDSWHEFSSIYRPAIVRLARSSGLQNADAEDLAQQVLLSVAKAIEGWEPDGRASFRTWLGRVTRNAVINSIRRRRPDRGSGNSKVVSMLAQQSAEVDSVLLATELRREAFHFAATEIRTEFQPGTWEAFWLTAVEGIKIETAAIQLNCSPGSIYAARSRVMKRLREKVQEISLFELD